MTELTMCGYCCDLCKAYAPNIEKNDQRKELSAMWKKYYDLDIPADNIYCDGCRSDKPCARRIDTGCQVRICVIEKRLEHCGDCENYPCDMFFQKEGLSFEEARSNLGDGVNADEYEEYLKAFDNKTRLDDYIKSNEVKAT